MKNNAMHRGGRCLAFALIFISLSGCAAPVDAPASSPVVTPTAAPVATLSPMVTPEPSPVATTAPDLTPEPASEPTTAATELSFTGQLVCTAGDSVNIRSQADKNSEVVGTLPGGAVADAIAYEDDWAHISYNGITGYVSRDYVVARHKPETDVPKGDWALILVSPFSELPDGFTVETAGFEGGKVDKRILKISEEMFADAKEDGVTLKLVDAYRSFELQSQLFEEKVNSYISKGYSREDAEAEAATITARPNTSEHQTGLAMDIVTPSYTKRDSGFAKTDAFKWLNANAQDYGFTLRYKKNSQDITGVIYEPWHWRFVGVEAARAMKKSGETLEEYLGLAACH